MSDQIPTLYVSRLGRLYRIMAPASAPVAKIERQASPAAPNAGQWWFNYSLLTPIYVHEDSIWNLDQVDHLIDEYERALAVGYYNAPNG